MQLQIFQNNGFKVRGGLINDEPYFMLSDICKALDIDNVSKVKTRLKEDGVTISEVIDILSRTQQATFINESNLYKVIFQSRKEEALIFQEWVTSEVLPSIRKTGSYSLSENQSKFIYQLERENIELKRAMNRMTENAKALFGNSMNENDFLDFIGYISRTTKTMRELAGYADYYANTAESFLNRIEERFKNHKGVQEQCKRLPKHQMRE